MPRQALACSEDPDSRIACISTPEGSGALYRSTGHGARWVRQPFPSGVGVNNIEFGSPLPFVDGSLGN